MIVVKLDDPLYNFKMDWDDVDWNPITFTEDERLWINDAQYQPSVNWYRYEMLPLSVEIEAYTAWLSIFNRTYMFSSDESAGWR